MMTDYVWRDGSRLTPYMAYQIDRLSADMLRLFGVEVRVTSGIRTNEEQTNIFTSSYTLDPGRRTVYDTRWWNGQLWYRIDSSGTVAQPGTSNHEIQGTAGAVDLQDTGNDGGIATMGSARSEWLRVNCGSYGMEPEGFSFGEAWHYKFPNIFLTVPAVYPTSEEDPEMPKLIKFDVGVMPNDPTYKLAPGFLYCHEDAEEQRVDRYVYGDQVLSLSAEDFYRLVKASGLRSALGAWGTAPSTWPLPAAGSACTSPLPKA